MGVKFNQSFKVQAVEKVLNRPTNTSIEEMAGSLGVGYSTLQKWLAQARTQKLEQTRSRHPMNQEKRPQDWNAEEKLNMVIACAPLNEAEISELCREKGIYPHHIQQWKEEFVKTATSAQKTNSPSEIKHLKNELKDLQKELRRKDKALAETAALLVLKKKANAIWGNDEDSSQ